MVQNGHFLTKMIPWRTERVTNTFITLLDQDGGSQLLFRARIVLALSPFVSPRIRSHRALIRVIIHHSLLMATVDLNRFQGIMGEVCAAL